MLIVRWKAELSMDLTLFTTEHEWDDAVLDASTRLELEDIVAWARANPAFKPGALCLFDGASSGDKATAAALLGKQLGVPVFRADLPDAASDSPAEPGRSLTAILERAQGEGSILFFDEADALFGKRSEVKDSHDRYAQLETSGLMMGIEDVPGIVILGMDLLGHMDEAFSRRFQWVVHFPKP